MRPVPLAASLFFTTLISSLSFPAQADRLPLPANPHYQEECAACHLAYPPALLDARSWQQVMKGLPKHFGVDASVDEPRRTAIADFLQKHAGTHKAGATVNSRGEPLLRITETAWFQREHHEVNAAVFKRASIKSAANCTACHTGAAEGNYSEHAVRIPR